MVSLSIAAAAREHPDRTFLVADGLELSFGQAAARTASVLAALRGEGACPERGARFVAAPTADVIFTLLACLEGGIPLVPLHPRWSQAERARAAALVPDTIAVEPAALRSAALAPAGSPVHDPERLGAVLFTSGTSGAPKGVRLARRCFEASARAHAANVPFAPDDRWLLAMPLCHAGGLSIVTRALCSRTAVVLGASPEPEAWLSAIEDGGATLASLVPAQLPRLLEADRAGLTRRLRAVLVGGAAFDPSLRRRADEAGVRALASYGLTETCSQIATQSPSGARAPGSRDSGRALPGVELCARGRRLWVRGDMVMLGYVGGPPVPRGAWLDTGDEGELGAGGEVFVDGRADDTLVTGGENVHPSEVERALLAAPGVADAAVFGVDDATWGQLVCAALVLAPGVEPRAALEGAAAELAPFKRPRRFVVLERIAPEGAAKVSRRALSAALAERLEPMSYERAAR